MNTENKIIQQLMKVLWKYKYFCDCKVNKMQTKC